MTHDGKNAAVPRSVEDHLLHPINFKHVGRARAEETPDYSGESTLKLGWSQNTADGLIAWLRTGGNLERLAQLLEAEPLLLAHPAVFWQVVHLRRVRHVMDWGDAREAEEEEGGALLTSEEEDKWLRRLFGLPDSVIDPRPPPGTRTAADSALQRLLTAFVSGMLPGWTLKEPSPVKRRRRPGRPRKIKEWQEEELLREFNELSAELGSCDDAAFRITPGQPRAKVERRMSQVVQQLHASSWRSLESRVPGDEWGALSKVPLPGEEARNIARIAIGKRRVAKHRLIYGLLAHYERRTVDQIRGTIERAEANYPEMDRRRQK